MEKIISFKINGYDDKDKIVIALTNSGYIVGAEQIKSDLGFSLGWKVDVYTRDKVNVHTNGFS